MKHFSIGKNQFNSLKKIIVFLVGTVFALPLTICGLAAQGFMTPAIQWMLGMDSKRAAYNATVFTLAASLGGIGGILLAGGNTQVIFRGIILFITALFAAIPGIKIRYHAAASGKAPTLSIIASSIFLVLLMQIIRVNEYSEDNLLYLHTILEFCLIGGLYGLFTALFQTPGGSLLTPALFLFTKIGGTNSIFLSLFVIAIGCGITLSFHRMQTSESEEYLPVMITSGILGGLLAGRMLYPGDNPLSGKGFIMASVIISLLYCLWQINKPPVTVSNSPSI